MKFLEFGDPSAPTIVLLHGGGLSWWSWTDVIEGLKSEYHLVAIVLDGHGEEGERPFLSIEDSASKLIEYVDAQCFGHVFALMGLSIGAQIVLEVLSQRPHIAKHAVVESALVFPIKATATLAVPMFKLFYGLIQKRWFSKWQSKSLFVTEPFFEHYYQDSLKMSKETLIQMTLSNGSYALKESLKKTNAHTLVIVGEKELGLMIKSAKAIHDCIEGSILMIMPKMGHGELSLVHSNDFIKRVEKFIISGELL